MCQRMLPRESIEALEHLDSDILLDDDRIPTEQEIADAFDYEEQAIEPDHCPAGCNGVGCYNCR